MRIMTGLFALMVASSAQAQTVANPRQVIFECPDHATDTGHEIDIVSVNADGTEGAVIQTIQGGDPALNADGDVVIPISVQPIKKGTYRIKVRVVEDGVKSVDSEASDSWVRAPGPPGKPSVQ